MTPPYRLMNGAHGVAALYVRSGRRSLATAAAMVDETPALRRKSLLVDGNNVLYHFYNSVATVEQCVALNLKCASSFLILCQRKYA